MVLNYIKLAFRLLLRNPFFSLINIAGLSVGFASFLLLWPYAEFELSSDKYHKDADRIVRLNIDFNWKDDNQDWEGFVGAFNWFGVAYEIQQNFAQVEALTRIMPQSYFENRTVGLSRSLHISYINPDAKRTSYRETNIALADPNLFEFFTIPLIEGNASTILTKPYSVALSQKVAKKYFGNVPAIGKVIYLNDSIALQVTGVYKDLPRNTHLSFDMVISIESWQTRNEKLWRGIWGYCYMKLRKGVTPELFEQAITARQDQLYDFIKSSFEHGKMFSRIQPLREIVFSNLRANDMISKSKLLLDALGIVSFVVLAFAWINYINLSATTLTKRLTELGVRKSVGASSRDFFLQFTVESVIINLMSFGIALTLVQLVKQPAEAWFKFYIPSWSEMSLRTTIVILITLILGMLTATFYPLMMISRKKPHQLFKQIQRLSGTGKINTILVTSQYVIAMALLVWIGAVYIQLNFIVDKDLGFQKEGLIVIEGPLRVAESNDSKIRSFMSQIKKLTSVTDATLSHSVVSQGEDGGLNIQREGSDMWFGADTNGGVDESFLKTYSIPLITGRNFKPDNPADYNSILISKALALRFGLTPEEAIGKKLLILDVGKSANVIGIFNDYEFRPFFKDHSETGRGVMLTYLNYLVPEFKPFKFTLRVNAERFPKELELLKRIYTENFHEAFTWSYLDEQLRARYANEQTAKNQISFFTVLAIAISCLGLLGMVTNKVAEKTKEICIRKILGAKLYHIGKVLIESTVHQVIAGTIIGIPIAYFLARQYLEKFSERITIPWWYYIVPVCILVVFMFFTIASLLWRAARSNPAESLRNND